MRARITRRWPRHFGADAVNDREGDVGAVLAKVNMDAEGSLAERRVDDPHDGLGDLGGIGVRRHNFGKGLLYLLAEAGVWTGLILGDPRFVGRSARVGKVVGAAGESAMIEVSIPQRDSSRAYCTAMASIPAFAAK
jgi:hypothetical protein